MAKKAGKEPVKKKGGKAKSAAGKKVAKKKEVVQIGRAHV